MQKAVNGNYIATVATPEGTLHYQSWAMCVLDCASLSVGACALRRLTKVVVIILTLKPQLGNNCKLSCRTVMADNCFFCLDAVAC